MILNHRWLNNSLVLKNLDVVVSPRLILLALARKAIGLEDKVKTSVSIGCCIWRNWRVRTTIVLVFL